MLSAALKPRGRGASEVARPTPTPSKVANAGKGKPAPKVGKTPTIESLQAERRRLQQVAVDNTVKEIELQRQQMDEQRKLGDIQLGLMRDQLGQTQSAAAQYMQQIGLLSQSAARQQEQADSQLGLQRMQEQNANQANANTANYRRNLLVQRRQSLGGSSLLARSI